MVIDLTSDDINLQSYHGISGFANTQSCLYNNMLKNTLNEYKNNKTLDGMDKNKKLPENIKKSDLLLGAAEFLEHKWLYTIHKQSPDTDLSTAILDGTDRYFGQIFTIMGFEPIINWFYTLNNEHGSLKLNYKTTEALLVKLFIRGKVCDDICRASYISNDFTYLFTSLNKLYKSLKDFDYWIEDDRDKIGWNTIKIYLMRTSHTLYGKKIAFELQLLTPKMFVEQTQSSDHMIYERKRLDRNPKVLDLYKSLNIDFDKICDMLKLNKSMSELIDNVLFQGKFIELTGKFFIKEERPIQEFCINHPDSSVFIEKLENNQLIIGNYHKSPQTNFQIVNGKMICMGTTNHYLTKQKIKTNGTKIKIEFMGTNLIVQFSPNPQCGFVGIKNRKGQTVSFIDNKQIWIRNQIYDKQIKWINDIQPPYLIDTKHKIHELVIKMKNRKCSYDIDGKSILSDISLEGAEILEQGYFHFGFASWGENPESTIMGIEFTELHI